MDDKYIEEAHLRLTSARYYVCVTRRRFQTYKQVLKIVFLLSSYQFRLTIIYQYIGIYENGTDARRPGAVCVQVTAGQTSSQPNYCLRYTGPRFMFINSISSNSYHNHTYSNNYNYINNDSNENNYNRYNYNKLKEYE